ncbi:uncharacterized protein LOC130734392 [Lotus japonicus]|uniref:uncharacterized protein LOC130734392 n=1 Tax=Lotus japonicus TaxID=34305 RepID=UPI002590D49C|nr:uncharacterized protein LOC130734392 [Lotus japonicus]
MVDQNSDQPTISFPISDGTGQQKPQKMQTFGATNIGVLGSNKIPTTYENILSMNDVGLGVQFRPESKAVGDESGICSPPLWSRTPPRSPNHGKHYYRSLSPASKTQAIERGQRELMEMVRGMPESNYELTLKDLVEHQRVVAGGGVGESEGSKLGEKKLSSNKNVQKKEKGSSRKVDSNKGQQVKRSGNIDSGGFYLKMAFPISLGSKLKKNKKMEQLANSNSSRVSPRTSVSDKDWWKKSLSASGGESESGVSSVNSGSLKSSGSSNSTCTSSSSRSNSRHEMSASSCWPFIRRPESLSQK